LLSTSQGAPRGPSTS